MEFDFKYLVNCYSTKIIKALPLMPLLTQLEILRIFKEMLDIKSSLKGIEGGLKSGPRDLAWLFKSSYEIIRQMVPKEIQTLNISKVRALREKMNEQKRQNSEQERLKFEQDRQKYEQNWQKYEQDWQKYEQDWQNKKDEQEMWKEWKKAYK